MKNNPFAEQWHEKLMKNKLDLRNLPVAPEEVEMFTSRKQWELVLVSTAIVALILLVIII